MLLQAGRDCFSNLRCASSSAPAHMVLQPVSPRGPLHCGVNTTERPPSIACLSKTGLVTRVIAGQAQAPDFISHRNRGYWPAIQAAGFPQHNFGPRPKDPAATLTRLIGR